MSAAASAARRAGVAGRSPEEEHKRGARDREADHPCGPQAPRPKCSGSQPIPWPTSEPPTYCMPSNTRAVVAAARLPPRSIEAAPESIEWTIEMASKFTMNATMTASRFENTLMSDRAL